MKRQVIKVGNVTIGGKQPAFILGPCVMESEKFVWRMARRIKEICDAESLPFIFKASYDKANRTSVRSFRGLSERLSSACAAGALAIRRSKRARAGGGHVAAHGLR